MIVLDNREKMAAMLGRVVVLICACSVAMGGRSVAGPCAPGGECAASVSAVPSSRPDPASTASAPIPRLAAGPAWRVALDGGASATAYSVAPVLGEEAAFGTFISSSARTAWSLELVEAGSLVLDRTTPQFGLVGVGGRHLARPEHPLFGPPDKTIDFQGIAAGLALAYDGRQLATGIGAETSVAYLIHGSHGISLHLGGYFFDASDLSRNTLVMLSVGYTFSPVRDRPYKPPVVGRDETHACRDLSAYRYALAEVRDQVAAVCKDEHAPSCEQLRDRTRVLNAALNRCLLGHDVGPPEVPHAP